MSKSSESLKLPALFDNKTWTKNLGKLSILRPDSPVMSLLADMAVQALLHAYEHGECSRCESLYDQVGGSNGAIRGESMKEWFRIMSGNQMTAKKNKDGKRIWMLKKGWQKDAFKLEDAIAKPFWEYMGAEKVNFFAFVNVVDYLEGLSNRIDRKNDNGEFRGDAEKTKASVAKILSFAKAEFNKLSPIERGETIDPALIASTPSMSPEGNVSAN